MKNKVTYILLAIVLITGIGFIAKSVLRSNKAPNTTNSEDIELAKVRAQDLETLKSESPEKSRLIESLLRYTDQNLPDSESFIQKYLSDEDEDVRAAALNAAGSYDWMDIQIYSEALKSKSENVRLSAVMGLARKSSNERMQLLKAHANSSLITQREWLHTKYALIKSELDAKKRDYIKQEILRKYNSWPEELQNEAIALLYRAFKGDSELIDISKTAIENKKHTNTSVHLHYLKIYDPDWIIKNVENSEGSIVKETNK